MGAMALLSPLHDVHREADAAILQYGPEVELAGKPAQGVGLVETYGELELEYAAVRKRCVVLDMPQRGTLELTGPERLEFLNRMLTQELKGQGAGEVRRSFWLNRKGRIDADLRVIELGDRTLLDVDVHAIRRTMEGLSSYIISEDCAITDRTADLHRLSLHGPTAAALVAAVAKDPASGADHVSAVAGLASDRAVRVSIAGHPVLLERDDATGERGLELLCPTGAVEAIYRLLLATGCDPDAADHEEGSALRRAAAGPGASPGAAIGLRPAGWHAYNIARIENGRPLFNLDFTTENLPAESGVIASRVSFTKGCYLGQEIVARMHSRGHPKQQLVALKVQQPAGGEGGGSIAEIRQPVTGSQVYVPPGEGLQLAEAVGAVTSSTISPMLGSCAICFAQVKFQHIGAGTELLAQTEQGLVRAVVQGALRFVERG